MGGIWSAGKLDWWDFPNRSSCAGEEATGLPGVGVSVLKGREWQAQIKICMSSFSGAMWMGAAPPTNSGDCNHLPFPWQQVS